ncbi:ABC transporter ATP-binding protein [Candidatus Woesearchaeota archaeon]|nr:ABC transporter ATP-binding protein [Candidatus Woesearchaeota archaeon]
MLEIKNLSMEIEGKHILKDVSITLEQGKVYALFGPNGSGKSTLINTIMGIYKQSSGSIAYDNHYLDDKQIDQITRLGISMAFQHPPEIRGVTLHDMINICLKRKQGTALDQKTKDLVTRLKLDSFLKREINVDFSGGERKRADMLQILLMKPKVLLLDEPDSGVDIESLKTICKELQDYITKNNASALIITHQGYIMDYIKVDLGCVLFNGSIRCYKDPREIIKDISTKGYAECVDCPNLTKDVGTK